MTFPIVLLVLGGLLFVIGLLGKIQVKEFNGGTDSKTIRILSIVIGIALMSAAYYVWREERGQEPAKTSNNSNQANASPSPVKNNEVFTIDTPKPGDSYEVPLDNGTGQIDVRGTLKGIDVDFGKAGIYVFTKTEGDNNEWWYDRDIDPDQNGHWTTIALAGSQARPIPSDKAKEKEVTIQAIVATDDAVKEAIGKNKFVNSLNQVKYQKISAPVTIRIYAKK